MAEYNPSKIIKDGNTYNFRDTTKIPLAGSNAISGSLIPATTDAYDLGGSSYQWNNAYIKALTINGTQFLPSDYVPRSGGGVISGTDLCRSVDNSVLVVGGGSANGYGATIELYGKDSYLYTGWLVVRPHDSINVRSMALKPDGTWTWDGQPIQYVSDQRFKQQITEIDDDLLTAWEDVNPVQFKYNDAVDQKKDKARLHTGYVVQQIDDACKSHNVDISKYGLYCHEEYAEETREVEHDDGTKTIEVVRPASEHYSLRYTEALIVECAYLRKCIKELRTEIEQLKSSK